MHACQERNLKAVSLWLFPRDIGAYAVSLCNTPTVHAHAFLNMTYCILPVEEVNLLLSQQPNHSNT
jgi:hypothetical protein